MYEKSLVPNLVQKRTSMTASNSTTVHIGNDRNKYADDMDRAMGMNI